MQRILIADKERIFASLHAKQACDPKDQGSLRLWAHGKHFALLTTEIPATNLGDLPATKTWPQGVARMHRAAKGMWNLWEALPIPSVLILSVSPDRSKPPSLHKSWGLSLHQDGSVPYSHLPAEHYLAP